ncbi:hypothetical protein A3K93_08630 [Acinetobacter sp. NCu2D-2]|uniref:KAP family P-loop NTPase fold protein n=1 Tax=Acinetobacter sp. NCu2D-2 TaxID=1608473 RepID=UPI0007CDD439|nr:P-loop NTPase fold protein [Acinetobacter sp. NCu2D-2]ANF82254.1 hypothetical protein A3K93_08630 [Acinetobacter sp. NCu2D-2]
MTTDQLNWQKDNLENIQTAWEGDLWDRRRLGEQLTNYVDRLECGAVLALDARWGEGKTWFVRHWKRHLETTQPHKHDVIYLDAFVNDYLDDPFLIIASEIAAKLDQTAQNKPLVHKFKKAAAVMQQGFLTLTPTLIASMISCALTGGIIPLIKINNENIKDKIDDAIDKVTENIGEKVTEAIQDKIDSYEDEKSSLQAFKVALSDLAASLEKPLVFIIDELDRCRPDFAIRLIERIKHFFDIPKIVFILVMDKVQFSKVVCHNYGYDEALGEEYLDKFIDFEIALNPLQYPYNDGVKSSSFLLESIGIDCLSSEYYGLDNLFAFLINSENITTRRAKKIANQFSFLSFDSNEKNQILLIYLVLLKQIKVMKKTSDVFRYIVDYFIQKFRESNRVINGVEENVIAHTDSDIVLYYASFQKISVINLLANRLKYYDSDQSGDMALGINYLPSNRIDEMCDFNKEWLTYIRGGLAFNIIY